MRKHNVDPATFVFYLCQLFADEDRSVYEFIASLSDKPWNRVKEEVVKEYKR